MAAMHLIANYFNHLLSLDTPTYTVAQIAKRFKPNTVLWAFHTIQQSSLHYIHFVIYYHFCSHFCKNENTISIVIVSITKISLSHTHKLTHVTVISTKHMIIIYITDYCCAFSALTLLVGRQEGHPVGKN